MRLPAGSDRLTEGDIIERIIEGMYQLKPAHAYNGIVFEICFCVVYPGVSE